MQIHEVPTPGKDLNEFDLLVKVAVGSLVRRFPYRERASRLLRSYFFGIVTY
jgi:hypothetical protein